MFIVHWQHQLTERRLNLFSINSFKIFFTILFILLNFVLPIDYALRYIFPNPTHISLWQIFYVSICRVSTASSFLLLLAFPSRRTKLEKKASENSTQPNGKQLEIFEYPRAFNIFTYFSKLNYCIFCVHITVGNYIVTERLAKGESLNLGSIMVSVFIWTMIFALVLNLTIEQPVINIFNLIMNRQRKASESIDEPSPTQIKPKMLWRCKKMVNWYLLKSIKSRPYPFRWYGGKVRIHETL